MILCMQSTYRDTPAPVLPRRRRSWWVTGRCSRTQTSQVDGTQHPCPLNRENNHEGQGTRQRGKNFDVVSRVIQDFENENR